MHGYVCVYVSGVKCTWSRHIALLKRGDCLQVPRPIKLKKAKKVPLFFFLNARNIKSDVSSTAT